MYRLVIGDKQDYKNDFRTDNESLVELVVYLYGIYSNNISNDVLKGLLDFKIVKMDIPNYGIVEAFITEL